MHLYCSVSIVKEIASFRKNDILCYKEQRFIPGEYKNINHAVMEGWSRVLPVFAGSLLTHLHMLPDKYRRSQADE
jgi:hypothetical protein